MRIFFTGGSGKAGRHVAPHLAEQGHQVTNADLDPLGHPSFADLWVDLTDAGETYSALAGLATFDELDLPEQPTYDAVVHFAAVPAILLRSDAATYATNVLSTYNVLEAATRLGVRKIVFASSETTYGICFAQGERRALYVPVDEDHPTVPEDSYARRRWQTRDGLRAAIVFWIERTYHRRRRQQTLGRLTPIEFEMLHQAAHAAGTSLPSRVNQRLGSPPLSQGPHKARSGGDVAARCSSQ